MPNLPLQAMEGEVGPQVVTLRCGYGYPYYYSEPAPDVAPSYALPTTAVVAGVQDQLTRCGYSPGPVDGVLGPQTRDAIADFQYGHGVPPTGQIDTALLQSLGLQ